MGEFSLRIANYLMIKIMTKLFSSKKNKKKNTEMIAPLTSHEERILCRSTEAGRRFKLEQKSSLLCFSPSF